MGQHPDIVFVGGQNTKVHPDFWRLVQVAGFAMEPIGIIDLVASTERTYIIPWWDDEVIAQLKERLTDPGAIKSRTTLVWWCIDRTLQDANPEGARISDKHEQLMTDADAVFDATWAACQQTASSDFDLTFVPVGGDDRLANEAPRRIKWDAALHAPIHAAEHNKVIKELGQQGLRLATTYGSYRSIADQPDGILSQTKIMVNIDDGYTAVRAAIAASYNMAMASVPTDGMLAPLVSGVDFVEAEDVATLVKRLVDGDPGLPGIDLLAENLHEVLVEDHPFEATVVKAVESLRRAGMN